MRRIALATVALIALAIGACAGRNSSLVPSATMPVQTGAERSPAALVLSGPGTDVDMTGIITSTYTGGFNLNTQFASGTIPVDTTQATISGRAPVAGLSVEVKGTGNGGNPPASITASSVAQMVQRPGGWLSLAGTVSSGTPSKFLLHTASGYIYVTTDSGTTFEGPMPAAGSYVQAVGPGSTSTGETAKYVSTWSAAPASMAVTGTITALNAFGFSLDAGAASPAVPVAVYSSTSVTGFPVVVGGTVTVTGAGTTAQGIVATKLSGASPSPNPSPTPVPIVLTAGGIAGTDDQFTPADGDSSSGGTGQTVDGIPCLSSMVENEYHVHAWLGILVNGSEIAVPDAIGMVNPGAEVNGVTDSGSCFYYIHTHDADGYIHLESPSTAPKYTSQFTLGNVADVWGQTISSTQVGPFTGSVRVFIAFAGSYQPYASNFTEYTGDPNALPLYSREAVWLEVGPTYVLPPNLRPVRFYTQY